MTMNERRQTVLIIDDDTVARLLARDALEQSGCAVEEAENGRRGIEAFAHYHPDLVLLDIMMPDMDGFAVCAKLRQLPDGKHVPVLIMTGLEDYQSITQAYDAGATDFVVKPVDGVLLGHRVRYLLRASQALWELRNSREEVLQARDAAVEGARLQSEFLATISHEIRTPMKGIVGMEELLLGTDLTAEQREYAETIKTSTHALLEVVDDMVRFSKRDAGCITLNREDFALSRVIEDSVAVFRELANEKGVVLRHDITSGVPEKLWGDPVHLGRLLSVLLSNAVKFTERGEILVQASQPSGEPKSGQRIDAGRIRLTVVDTGIGISETDARRLFQPVVQVDGSDRRKYGGTGLGLALAKQLVELMGGTIKFQSQLGKGSRFWCDLPLGRVDNNGPKSNEPRGALVYVKEGVSEIVIRRTLEKLGYQVHTIAEARQLQSAGTEGVPLLLIADLDVLTSEAQRMDVQSLKGRFPRLRVLGLGHGSIQGPCRTHLPFYLDGYLEKPLTVEAIKAAVGE